MQKRTHQVLSGFFSMFEKWTVKGKFSHTFYIMNCIDWFDLRLNCSANINVTFLDEQTINLFIKRIFNSKSNAKKNCQKKKITGNCGFSTDIEILESFNSAIQWMIETISRERRSLFAGDKIMSHFPFRGSPPSNNTQVCDFTIFIDFTSTKQIVKYVEKVT